VRCECDYRLGPARGSHELYFEGVWPVDLNDRPEITSAQTGVRNVTRQYNGVQKIEHDSPRENGHQTWKVLFRMDDPHSPDRSRSPRWGSQDTIDLEFAPVGVDG